MEFVACWIFWSRQNLKTDTAHGMMNAGVVIRKFFRAENMVPVQPVCEVVVGKVGPNKM
jgi:hypothetical protein